MSKTAAARVAVPISPSVPLSSDRADSPMPAWAAATWCPDESPPKVITKTTSASATNATPAATHRHGIRGRGQGRGRRAVHVPVRPSRTGEATAAPAATGARPAGVALGRPSARRARRRFPGPAPPCAPMDRRPRSRRRRAAPHRCPDRCFPQLTHGWPRARGDRMGPVRRLAPASRSGARPSPRRPRPHHVAGWLDRPFSRISCAFLGPRLADTSSGSGSITI